MKALLVPWLTTTVVLAFPNEFDEIGEKETIKQCDEIMANNGLNFSSFGLGAAHGLHSISLEEVRHFFEPEATEENKIPVVNTNFSAEQTILFNSPLRGYDEDFTTMALQVMAFFMVNDKPYFYQQGVNTLEKLAHQYHMHEIYAAAAPIYRRMKEDPPADPGLCPCVNDATGNGILEELVMIAKKMKFFARKRGVDLGYTANLSYKGKKGKQGKRQRGRKKQSAEVISKYEKEYLADSSKENARKLLDIQPWKPNTLVGSEQWISFEAMLTWSMLDEEELNDFSVFMFCKLNHPDLDHDKDLFE